MHRLGQGVSIIRVDLSRPLDFGTNLEQLATVPKKVGME